MFAETTTKNSGNEYNYEIEDDMQEYDCPGSLFDPVEIPRICPRNFTQRRRVIDVTWVNHELTSLELRLNELWDVVDVFFISESTISWKAIPLKNQTLMPKPLYLTEHWEDFKKFHTKMVVNIIPPEVSFNTKYTGNLAIEMAQRDKELGSIQKLLSPHPEDLLIFADLDEIPRPHEIEKLACGSLPQMPVCLTTSDSFYYYNYKCHLVTEWTMRPRVAQWQNAKSKCATTIQNASSHCSSCFGSVDFVRNKILSNADVIKDSKLQVDPDSILDRIRNCKDVYLRKKVDSMMSYRNKVNFQSIPLIVAKHPERWPYLLGKGPLYEDEDIEISRAGSIGT